MIRFVPLIQLLGRLEGSAISLTIDKDVLDEMLINYESQGNGVRTVVMNNGIQKMEIEHVGWIYCKNLTAQDENTCLIKN